MQKNDPAGLAHAKKLIEENIKTQANFLDLGNCGLVDLSELPELWELGHLEGLNMGYVYYENNEWIPSSNEYSSNKIGDNGVMSIADKLLNLSSLYLSYNKIGNLGAIAIADKLINLSTLSLSYNKIGDNGAIAIANNLFKLSSLSLSYNNMGEKGAIAIADKLRNLTVLDLSNNKIGENGAIAIADKILHLISLHLSHNNIGEKGSLAIADKLLHLASLDLSQNKISNQVAIKISSNLKLLTKLHLSQNKIGDEGVKAISTNLSNLTSLHLSSNEVSHSGLISITKNLKQLTELSYSAQIGDEGAKLVSENLTNLTYLSLYSCSISDVGVNFISQNLRHLNHLSLMMNRIGDKGAIEISLNLKKLSSLDLSYNQIGDNGAIAIGENLTQLSVLHLQSNQIGTKGVISICENLKQLELLDLWNNKIGDAGVKKIVNSLRKLTFVDFNVNKTRTIPEEILSNIAALKEYFKAKLIPNFTTKIILIGNTSSGKTSLANYFKSRRFTKIHESTHGIKQYVWHPIIDNKKYKVHIRDFGGQDYFHATHNLFLDSESLFLLLHTNEKVHISECKEADQYQPINYWLGNISDMLLDTLTKDEIVDEKCTIWYIQNKTDHKDYIQEWLNGQDHSKITKVENQFFISIKEAAVSKGNKPFKWHYFEESLKNKIVALSQSEIVDWWAAIRDKALPNWRNESLFMKRTEFAQKCKLFLENTNFAYYAEDESFSNVLTYLKNSGEVVNFNDRPELEDYIFTGADTLTNYLFKEILNKEAKENNGIIKNLKNNKDTQLFINVLLAYGLIFEDPTNIGVYIAPQFLPVEPHIAKFIHLMPLGFAIRFMTYMPRYLITRLITYFAQKYEDAHYWRYGVMYKKSGLICLIRVDANAQIIYVHVEDKKEKYDALYEIYLMIMGNGMLSDLIHKVRDVSRQESFSIALAETQKMEKREKQMEFSLNGVDFAPFAQWRNAIESKAQYVLTNDHKYLSLNATVYKIIGGYSSATKRIFLSYAHADGIHLENFKNHLSSLERSGKIATWYDGKILAGQSWDDTIRKALQESDIVLALLSNSFMSSQYIWEIELPEAAKAGAVIVPIFLSPVYCDDDIVFLSKKQGLPKGEKWILGSAWHNTDEAWLEVVKGIVGLL